LGKGKAPPKRGLLLGLLAVQERFCANPAVATSLISAVIVGDAIVVGLLRCDLDGSLGLDGSDVPGATLELGWCEDVDLIGVHDFPFVGVAMSISVQH
jgi:hypothetical protein